MSEGRRGRGGEEEKGERWKKEKEREDEGRREEGKGRKKKKQKKNNNDNKIHRSQFIRRSTHFPLPFMSVQGLVSNKIQYDPYPWIPSQLDVK